MPWVPCPTPDKVGHSTRYAAEAVLVASRRMRRRHGSPPIRAYQCACGLWHVTSKPYNP